MKKLNLIDKIKENSGFLWKLLVVVLLLAVIFKSYGYRPFAINKSSPEEAYLSAPQSMNDMKSDGFGYDTYDTAAEMDQSEALQLGDEDRKVILSSSLVIQVKDGEESYNKLKADLDKYSAYIENANVYETYIEGNPKAADLNVKVQKERFEEFLTYVKTYGYVKSENQSALDVTDQYKDYEADLTNLKLREEKIREFYNNAKTVEETLSIYRELSSLQYQIESIEKNLQNLDKNITYVSVYISFTPEVSITDITNPEWNFAKIWREAVNELIVSFQLIASFVVRILVFAPIWLAILLIAWFVRRRIMR